MPKTATTVSGLRCERCNHEWIPKQVALPHTCPHCRSPYWDRPRQRVRRTLKERTGVESREIATDARPVWACGKIEADDRK